MDEEVIVPAEEAPAEEVVVETPEDTPEEEETPEELKARLTKAEELANNYKIRAEKAEKKAKDTTAPAAAPGLSLGDMHALRDVHEDDLDRVEKFAKSEGISIKEAMKNDELKAILDIRKEKRSTALAANVGTARRGATKMTDDALLDAAASGKLPDDEDGINRLIAAKAKKR